MKHKEEETNATQPEKNWPKTNGMTVPDGYFRDFTRRMMSQIPEEEPKVIKLTTWQKIRPYAYMAAMFAGAYLMLNMFSLGRRLSPAESPAAAQPTQEMLAQVVNTNTLAYVDDYISMSDYDIYTDLYESGFEIPENI